MAIAPPPPAAAPGPRAGAALTDYRVIDLATFRNATAEPRQIAGLYFYSVLDPLIELAHSAANDFFRRPELYISLAAPTPPLFAKLAAAYGADPTSLSADQRSAIYASLFGQSEQNGSQSGQGFASLRDALLNAARAFVESTSATSADSLRQVVKDAQERFKSLLTSFHGSSVRWSKEGALDPLTEATAYPILRDAGVAGVFGVTRAPLAAWPYGQDANGDKLVEQMGVVFSGSNGSRRPLARDGFGALQRVAIKGVEAIASILDFDPAAMADADLDRMVRKCYSWATAIAAGGSILVASAPQPNGTPRSSSTERPVSVPAVATLSRR